MANKHLFKPRIYPWGKSACLIFNKLPPMSCLQLVNKHTLRRCYFHEVYWGVLCQATSTA